MHRIEYEIKLNDNGRPCIDLPKDHEDKPEDKFFAIELARYFLQSTHSRMTAPPYDQHTIDEMDRAIRLLGQIGDEMAHLMWDSMKTMGEVAIMLNSAYHITVNSIEERDDLPFDYFTHESKLFKRQEGLRVYVMYPYENYDKEKSGLYELKNGINNENWVKLSK